MSSHTGFRRMSQTLRWCVTLWCRLLVTVRPLRLVVLVFEGCLKLHGGVLLFDVGCWLLCDRYIWSYWFSTLLVVHAFCTASDCGFLAVNWAVGVIWKKIFPFSYFLVISLLSDVLCFVAVSRSAASWVIWNKTAKTWWTGVPGKPCGLLFIFHGLNLRAGLASLGSWWRIRCH